MRCAEADGISSETLALALIGEALPPIVHEHGPIWAATVLMKLARRLRARAFSSEVGTGSREENASKQKTLPRAVDNDGAELVAFLYGEMSLRRIRQRELRGDVVNARAGGQPF